MSNKIQMNALLSKLSARHWYYLFALIFLLRFAFIRFNGTDLIGDESYYWDWSRRPDWCYFSKPPFIAWLIGSMTWVFGDNMPAVRLGAVLTGTAFLVVYYLTARAFFSEFVANIAVVLILVTPANAISNLLMTIDPPLYLFWILTVYYLYKALFEQHSRSWIYAGIATALAFLSKPTAIALPILLAGFLMLKSDFRHQLYKNYLWYILPVIISFIPLVIWNMDHEWIMLQHNQGHFQPETRGNVLGNLGQSGLFLIYQLLLFSPVVFILVIYNNAVLTLHYKNLKAKELFLLLMGPIPLFAVLGLSLLQKVQGNWAIPFYFTSLLLLSHQLAEQHYKKWLKPALIIGGSMVCVVYVLPFVIEPLGLSNTRLDPTYRLRQWNSLATQIQAVRTQQFKTGQKHFILVDSHRYLVSELAFYLPDQPIVFRYSTGNEINSQYEIWPGPVQYLSQDGMLISDKGSSEVKAQFKPLFKDIIYLDTVTALQGSRKERKYYVYFVKELKAWPTP